MRMTRAGSVALLALAVALEAGCAATLRSVLQPLGFGSKYQTGISEEELRDELAGFTNAFVAGISATADRIASESTSTEMRRRSLVWKVRMVPLIEQAGGVADPQQRYVALLSLATSQRQYLEAGEGRDVFGALQPLAVEEATAIWEDSLRVGATFLSPEQLEGIRWQVDQTSWKYPMRGIFESETVVSGLAQADSAGAFDWIIGIPMAPFKALQGVDSGAQAIREFNATAQGFSTLVARLPEVTRWQAELFAYDLEARDSTKQALSALDTLAASSAQMSDTAARLPEDVRGQVEAVLARIEAGQSQLRELLTEGRAGLTDLDASMGRATELSASLTRLAEEANRAGATWQGLVADVRGPEGERKDAAPSHPFDVLEYERTAARVESAAGALHGLVSELRDSRAELGSFMNGVLWRALVLLVAFFALRFAFAQARAAGERGAPKA